MTVERTHLTVARILITTGYLTAGDEIDTLLRRHGHEPVYFPYTGPREPADRETLFNGVDGAILASEPVTADMLTDTPRLKVLARSGVGYDSIDVPAATALGIRVCNAPGTNHHSVAELTIGLVIMAARRLAEVTAAVQQGRWPRGAGHELHGSTLGIIGYGPSGRATAQIGAALGMTVQVSTSHPDTDDPAVHFTDLDTVIRNADYLSLHTRADHSTRRLIDGPRLQTMKPTAVLINTAGGSLVDEDALAKALAPAPSPAPPSTFSSTNLCP
ncbi:NAD(P)-dependent oxidoreductase [Arthrobacter sp. ISL-72]|uniref:NAD(P)-dependent oxidoreductase n=1 Tax=Arthrobacter sp. ISL-72 TaxID=2819114 RepID=UPI00288B2D1F|nr:NAD(P)-dependent oxidoreductase [Arthrobacter sp. ISL-72]